MTRDDIIRMAREAGLNPIYSACDEPDVSYAYEDWDEEIEKFAALVAAAEREACAKVCEARYMGDNNREDMEARRCADAIRARGQA
jgi:phosphoserine phosphatase